MMLVDAARKYTGVRFRHRGRSAHALDCAGLIWRSYYDCGVELPDFRLYSREPNDDGLVKHVAFALGDPVAVCPVTEPDLNIGDVIVVRFDIEPHHLCLVTNYRYGGLALLHACGMNKRVIEHRLSPDRIKRITHVFRRPV